MKRGSVQRDLTVKVFFTACVGKDDNYWVRHEH